MSDFDLGANRTRGPGFRAYANCRCSITRCGSCEAAHCDEVLPAREGREVSRSHIVTFEPENRSHKLHVLGSRSAVLRMPGGEGHHQGRKFHSHMRARSDQALKCGMCTKSIARLFAIVMADLVVPSSLEPNTMMRIPYIYSTLHIAPIPVIWLEWKYK